MSSKQRGSEAFGDYEETDFRGPALDLLRISQKTDYTERLRCTYGAPYIAVVKDGIGTIGQGCCKQWSCPRCSKIYAAWHQHRMIEGVQLLMETGPMYFWTITCRGKDLDYETADDDYLLWTNRLLSACRYQAKKQHGRWAYVQITERQKRGAAHSHFLHTWIPGDSILTIDGKGVHNYSSRWFTVANVRAGLGPQCRISQIKSSIGAASYVAKYLKKHLSDAVWPSHWRRIRYSENFPDTTEKPDFAIAIVKDADWKRLETHIVKTGQYFHATNQVSYQLANHRIVGILPPEIT